MKIESSLWTVLPIFLLGGCLLAQQPAESADNRLSTQKAVPGFFVPNLEGDAKRLIDREGVIAFMQGPKGRILFTADGAYFSVGSEANKRPSTPKGESLPRTVVPKKGSSAVFKTGFDRTDIGKRGITPRLAAASGAVANFFIGRAANKQIKVPLYRELVYDRVWDGISVVYEAQGEGLGLRVMAEPSANLAAIEIETGATLTLLPDGSLNGKLGDSHVQFARPEAFQTLNGRKTPVAVNYRVLANTRIGFETAVVDPGAKLTIIPRLSWSTYLGGRGGDRTEAIEAVALDSSGNIYVTGTSGVADFPVTPGSYDESWNGLDDVFVAKLNPTGDQVVYATFLGGDGDESGFSITVDEAGSAYVQGSTASPNFPITDGAAFDVYSGERDVFVCKLTADGSALVYSTFLGGGERDAATGITLDPSGNAVVAGWTSSMDFPTTAGAFNTLSSGSEDAYISKLNSSGTALLFSTYLGGQRADAVYSLTMDGEGSIFVAGTTYSQDFPTTSEAFDLEQNGSNDGFVSKFDATGSRQIFSTFLGGITTDEVRGIAVDQNGNTYLTGSTVSFNFPITTGAYSNTNRGSEEGFVTKLDPQGRALVYSSFFGSGGRDNPLDLAIDDAGKVYIVGYTESQSFPTTENAFDTDAEGSTEGFICQFNEDGSRLEYATLLGGAGTDRGYGIVYHNGVVVVVGETQSSNFPATHGFPQTRLAGLFDGFVTRLDTETGELLSSTLLGGGGGETAGGVAVDAADQVYVVGSTSSFSFPTIAGVHEESPSGGRDVFVTKFSADGRDLLYATFLGGGEDDQATAIFVDAAGNATVTGETHSADFPVSQGAFGNALQGGSDVFVARLNSDGSALTYATFVGGSGDDRAHGLDVDLSGRTTVTGQTFSADFPSSEGALDSIYNGNGDGFVFRLNQVGGALEYATFLGGSGEDIGWGLALDSQGNTHVVGETRSSDFPFTKDALGTALEGSKDGFVAKISDPGDTLLYATFLGGSSQDECHAVAVDSGDNFYVAGETWSSGFPVTEGAFGTQYLGLGDVWVAKFDQDGTHLSWATYLSSYGWDYLSGIAVDENGSVVVVGSTSSRTYPVTLNAYDQSFNGVYDAFVTRLSPDGETLWYSTFLGGLDFDAGRDVALTGDGNAVAVGFTRSPDYPVSENAPQPDQSGDGDVFVTKLCMAVPNQPADIIGTAQVCADETGLTYSIAPMDGVSGYVWGIPFGASIISGQGTTEITVSFGPVGGHITVYAHNDCGPGLMQAYYVSVTPRFRAPEITGSPVVCAGDTDVIYTITPDSNATGYRWTVLGDAQITSGQGTSAVSVTFGSEGAEISVAAENACGIGPSGRLVVGLLDETPVTVADTPRLMCPGESTTLTASTADAKTVTHQWFRDDVLLPGETRGSLVVPRFDAIDPVTYHCEVTGSCGTFTSNTVELVRDSLQQATLTPLSHVLTTQQAPVFDVRLLCSLQDLTFAWMTTPATETIENGASLVLDPPPAESTRVDVTVSDQVTGAQYSDYAWLLVPTNDGFEDFNGDGCRNELDLWQLAQFWQQPYDGDPNDDGKIDVRDLLYLGLVDSLRCSE